LISIQGIEICLRLCQFAKLKDGVVNVTCEKLSALACWWFCACTEWSWQMYHKFVQGTKAWVNKWCMWQGRHSSQAWRNLTRR